MHLASIPCMQRRGTPECQGSPGNDSWQTSPSTPSRKQRRLPGSRRGRECESDVCVGSGSVGGGLWENEKKKEWWGWAPE